MNGSLTRHAARGPHPVGVRTLEVPDPGDPARRLPVDVWYPTAPGLAGRDLAGTAPHPFQQPHHALPDAPPVPGRHPLLGFSHGNSGLRRQSTFLTTHLASHGFVVAAPDHVGNTFAEMLRLDEEARRRVHFEARRSRPRDLVATLDAVLGDAQLAGCVDPGRVGVFGHSYGGYTALKMARRDPRVRAVCGLAPASEPFVGRKAFEPGELPLDRGVPSLLVAAMDDVLVDLETSVHPLFERLAAPRALVGVADSDHFHFCDGIPLLHGMHEQNLRPQQPRPARPLAELVPEGRMHRLVRGVVTAWFGAALATGGPGADPGKLLSQAALCALDPALCRLDGA